MDGRTRSRLMLATLGAAIVLLALLVNLYTALIAASVLAVGMAFEAVDELLKVTKALPDGAATVVSGGIDLEVGPDSDFVAPAEFQLDAPALTTVELDDDDTMIYDLYHDTASDFSTEVLLASAVITQTGAGGAGAAAATARYRPPTTIKRYVRAKATNSGGGDATGKSLTLALHAGPEGG